MTRFDKVNEDYDTRAAASMQFDAANLSGLAHSTETIIGRKGPALA